MVSDFSEPTSWSDASRRRNQQSFLGEAADVFRSVVPQGVRDVVGKTLRAGTSAEYALNTISPEGRQYGTELGESIGSIPYVGGAARTAFDVGAAPINFLTAGLGSEALIGSRAAMLGSRALGVAPEIGSSFGGRLLGSAAANIGGAYGGHGAEYLAEKAGLPDYVQLGAGLLGGAIGGGLGVKGSRLLRGIVPEAGGIAMGAVEGGVPTGPQFEDIIGASLPKDLTRATPGYGTQNIDWGSDIEKALYIVGGKNKSKAHDRYMDFLMGNLNMDEREVRSLAQEVRQNVVNQAKAFEGEGPIVISRGSVLTPQILNSRGILNPFAETGGGGAIPPTVPPVAEGGMQPTGPSLLEQYGGEELSGIASELRRAANESAGLRQAGGIAEQEISQSRLTQAENLSNAIKEAVEKNLTREQAQELYSSARYLGGAGSARQTYATGFDLTDEMWRKINAAVSKMADDGVIGRQDVANIMGTSGSVGAIERLAMGIGPFNNYDIRMIRTILGDEAARAASQISKTPVTQEVIAQAAKTLPPGATDVEKSAQRKAQAVIQQSNVTPAPPTVEGLSPEIKRLAASSREEIENATPDELEKIYEAKRIVEQAERATTAQSSFLPPDEVPLNPPGFGGEGGLERAPFAEGRTTPRISPVEQAELSMARRPGESDIDYQNRLSSNFMLGENAGYRQPGADGSTIRAENEPALGAEILPEGRFGQRSMPMEDAERLAITIKMYERQIRDQLEAGMKKPIDDSVWENIKDLLSSPRAIMASGDLSYTLRQASMAAPLHPEIWAKSVANGIKAAASEDAAILSQAKILADPAYKLAQRAGLAIVPLAGADRATREEEFQRGATYVAKFLEKFPLLKQSERAYVTTSNEFRMGIFKNMLDSYYSPEKLSSISDKELQQIGSFVNAITGRGNIPQQLEPYAPFLNSLFFSPRNFIGKVQTNLSLFSTNSAVRQEAAKSLISYYGTGMSILAVARLAGADVGTDPNSSDFGKIKLPSGARIDIWGGNAQIYRLISNLASGSVTSTEGVSKKQSRFDTVWNFLHSKMAPVPSAALEVGQGTDYSGRPQTMDAPYIADKAISMVTPLFVKELADQLGVSVNQETKKLPTGEALALGAAGLFGVGGSVNQSEVLGNIIKRGGYSKLSGVDQLSAISQQAWQTMASSRPELKQYKSYSQWQAAQIDRLTEQYKSQGLNPAIAREKAVNRVGNLGVANSYSNARQKLEKKWIAANPETAIQILNEDEGQPYSSRRLQLSKNDISTLNRSMATIGQ